MEVIWFCKHIHIARHVPFILNINANTCTLPNSRRHHSVRAPMLVCSFALTPFTQNQSEKKVWRCSNVPANSNKGTILTMPSRQQSWGCSLSISCKLKFGKDNCRTWETGIKDYRVLEWICFTWDNPGRWLEFKHSQCSLSCAASKADRNAQVFMPYFNDLISVSEPWCSAYLWTVGWSSLWFSSP